MSLAEDLFRPFDELVPNRETSNPLRKQLIEMQSKITPYVVKDTPVEAIEEPTPPPSVRDTSLELLDRASSGLMFVLTRYKQLEEHLKQLDAWSKAQIQAAEAASLRWQETAAAAGRQVQELQKSLDQMNRRVEAAENAVNDDKEALTFLQDRIIAAFGFGSEAHDALKAAGLD